MKLNSCFPLDWCDRARGLHLHETLMTMTEMETCNFATSTSSARCATYVKASPKEMISTDDVDSLEFLFIDNACLNQTLCVSARIVSPLH